MVDEPQPLSDLEAAIRHGAAVVLLELQSLGRGYTTLVPHGPAVTKGVEAAQAEAEARSVPKEEIHVSAPVIMATAQQMAAAGVDPNVIIAETRSEAGASAEKEKEEAAAKEKAEAEEHAKADEAEAAKAREAQPVADPAPMAPAAPAEATNPAPINTPPAGAATTL